MPTFTPPPPEVLVVVGRGVFGSVGLLLFGFAAWLVGDNLVVLQRWQQVPGVVVASERIGPSGQRHPSYSLQVRYQGVRGPVTVSVRHASFRFTPGETLSLYHRPGKPREVVVNDWRTIWFVPLLTGVVGGLLLYGAWSIGRPAAAPATHRRAG
jgi:hypothetical protein